MNRYKKTIRTIRNRHNRIVAFSQKMQKTMGLTDNDMKIVFRKNTSWELPDSFRIRCGTSLGIDVLIIETSSEARWAVKVPPSKTKQKEFIRLIKTNG